MQQTCPLCFSTTFPHPGGIHQCSSCALVFTVRAPARKPIEAGERREVEPQSPERKQPPEANPEAVHLSGSVRQHGAAYRADDPSITRTTTNDGTRA
jgi:hypothetical protein